MTEVRNLFKEDEPIAEPKPAPLWWWGGPFLVGCVLIPFMMSGYWWHLLNIIVIAFITSGYIAKDMIFGLKPVREYSQPKTVFFFISAAMCFLAAFGPIIFGTQKYNPVDGFVFPFIASMFTMIAYMLMILSSAYIAERGWVDSKYLRGAKLIKPAQFRTLMKERGAESSTPAILGTLPYPKGSECLHTLIMASTGSGKSQTLMHLLESIRERGDRAVVLDNNGEMSSRFFKPDDLIVNPFKNVGPGWRLASEVQHRVDWERLASAFIGEGAGNSKEWMSMAKAMFSAVGASLWELYGRDLTNAELQRALVAASPQELAPLVRGTSVEALAVDDERASSRLQSVRMSFIDNLKSWQYVPDGDFSFREWMTDRQQASWLFVPYTSFQLPIARVLISAWTDILISAALEGGESNSEKITWIIIDELESLGEIESLLSGVAQLRKARVAIVAVVQDHAQLRKTYGNERAETLSNNLSHKLIMKANSADSAERMSRMLGDTEILEEKATKSYSDSQGSSSTSSESISLSQDIKTRRLVLASELQTLPDLHGFVKFTGDWPVVPVVVPVFQQSTQAAE